MANPTTNYGFVLPTPTDLVTDLPADFDVALQGVDTRLKALQPNTTLGDIAYASATANTNVRLGIGTTGQVLGVVAGVPAWTTGNGLNLINTTSFSAVSSQSINDVFSATYNNYKIILNLDSTSSTAHETVMRLRVGGADLSSASYNASCTITRSSNTYQGSYVTNRTFLPVGGDGAIAQGCQYFIELGNPFRTTGKHTATFASWGIASSEDCIKFFNCQVAAGTSYTGFSIVNLGTGTITGSVSVYGYSK